MEVRVYDGAKEMRYGIFDGICIRIKEEVTR